MNAKAGIVTSQVAWLGTVPFLLPDWKAVVVGFPIAMIASHLPDLDHSSSTAGRNLGRFPWLIRRLAGGHRMGMHSIFAVVGFGWLVGFFILPTTGLAVSTGWLAHVVCDLLTVQGVGFFYPLSDRKVSLGWMVTGERGETVYIRLMQGAGALLILFYGYQLGGQL